ncbi:hypothetical protein AYO47_08820, partial [Planctomyces sp. SCGC AG-212-M04]
MQKPIISIDSLGKRYSVAHERSSERYVALREVLGSTLRGVARAAAGFVTGAGRPDSTVTGQDFWALRDITLDVEEGDVVGVIGRNGAGKSTLLKVLSRITEPTEGRVVLRGRVASLLEVGTGFHPELSGRENIFLNGSILGMTRGEVRRKLDEIVAFAEVSRFLDTPVKRYSSGMYVRLAFSVAAHLDPEILIVDEVLAVGDHAFQKKCIGRLKDVSSSGRTVLLVTHNTAIVQALCNKAVYLKDGRCVSHGPVQEQLALYLSASASDTSSKQPAHLEVVPDLVLTGFTPTRSCFISGDSLEIDLEVTASADIQLHHLCILLYSASETRLAAVDLRRPEGPYLLRAGTRYCITAVIESLPLITGSYSLGLHIGSAACAKTHLGLANIDVEERLEP